MAEDELEAMTSGELLAAAAAAGLDVEGLHTRQDFIAALTEHEPAPEAEPEPEPAPEALGPIEAGVEEHAVSADVPMSVKHKAAVCTAIRKVMYLDEIGLDEIGLGSEDMRDVGPFHARTTLSVPGAPGCAVVLSAGPDGEHAQATVNPARIRRRHAHLA